MNTPPTTLPVRSDGLIDELVAVLLQSQRRDISAFSERFLMTSLEKRMVATNLTETAAYLEYLGDTPEEAEYFLRSLNINYSAFFRNPLTYAVLEQVILPGLVGSEGDQRTSSIRIWSAGCAAGQEAWSVAILLESLAVARERPFPYRIIATDIADEALTQARQGVYNLAEVQNTPLKCVQAYFSVRGDTYEIIPALKAHVDFSTYDLLDEESSSPAASIYGDFDLVLCSNLLFYYRPDSQKRILDKVCRALRPGGYLVTGETERDIVRRKETLRTVMPFAPVFQKIR